MGAGRSMSSRSQLGYKPNTRSLPVPAPKQQFGKSKNRSSGGNIANYVPEQRSREEQATAISKAKEDEQSAQWSRATSEMKTPNVMYDDRNQTEIAGKYADDQAFKQRSEDRAASREIGRFRF